MGPASRCQPADGGFLSAEDRVVALHGVAASLQRALSCARPRPRFAVAIGDTPIAALFGVSRPSSLPNDVHRLGVGRGRRVRVHHISVLVHHTALRSNVTWWPGGEERPVRGAKGESNAKGCRGEQRLSSLSEILSIPPLHSTAASSTVALWPWDAVSDPSIRQR